MKLIGTMNAFLFFLYVIVININALQPMFGTFGQTPGYASETKITTETIVPPSSPTPPNLPGSTPVAPTTTSVTSVTSTPATFAAPSAVSTVTTTTPTMSPPMPDTTAIAAAPTTTTFMDQSISPHMIPMDQAYASIEYPKKVTLSADEKSKIEKKRKQVHKQRLEEEKKEHAVISSLDTLTTHDEGNWLLKRVWWEQAENTFEKLIEVNDKIVQAQTDYFNKQKEIDKKLTESFLKFGYQKGELEEIIEYLLGQAQKERKKEGNLDPEEIQFFVSINDRRTQLEELNADLSRLSKMGDTIEEVLSQVINQISLSREYEKKSWDDFKEIGRVLDDKRAKALFYEIDGNLRNVQNIFNYLKKDLQNYFSTLLKKTEDLSASITDKLNKLSSEGLNFKREYELVKKYEEEEQAKLKDQKAIKEIPKKQQKGWIATFIDWINPLNWFRK